MSVAALDSARGAPATPCGTPAGGGSAVRARMRRRLKSTDGLARRSGAASKSPSRYRGLPANTPLRQQRLSPPHLPKMVRAPRPRSSGGDGPLPSAKRVCTSGSAGAYLVLDDLPGVDLVLDDLPATMSESPTTAPAGSPAGGDGGAATVAVDAAAPPPAPSPSPPPLGLMGLPGSVLSTIIDAMDMQTRVRFGRTCTAAAAAAL